MTLVRLAAAALCAGLAGCGGSGATIAPGVVEVAAGQPVAAGAVRFQIENPDAKRWTASIRQGAPDGSVRYGFTCKVIACPDPAVVIVTTRASSAQRPDGKALEKLARESIPKLTQAESLQMQVRSDNKAKAEMLSSNVVQIMEYPAVAAETKVTIADRSRFIANTMVFAGRMIVNVRAEAADRATARKASDDFARAFRVEEGPPLQ